MKTEIDAMPKEVATALPLSGQSTSNRFRKVCKTARERVCEPVSRSTRLNVSAPATPLQKFERKLRNANAKQLTTWARRASRKGERLQDILFHAQQNLYGCPERMREVLERTVEAIERQIDEIDVIAQAINSELTNRSARGKVSHV